MIEKAIRHILVNDTGVKAITTRCYPVKTPQKPTYPLIVYHKISGWRDHHLQGASGLANPRFQIESWAKTYEGAKTLSEAIRGALDGYTGTADGTKIGSCLLENENDFYEHEIEIYRIVQDYLVWHEE
jgi:hypothetical protein